MSCEASGVVTKTLSRWWRFKYFFMFTPTLNLLVERNQKKIQVKQKSTVGGGNSNLSYFHPIFDEHIFQMGGSTTNRFVIFPKPWNDLGGSSCLPVRWCPASSEGYVQRWLHPM